MADVILFLTAFYFVIYGLNVFHRPDVIASNLRSAPFFIASLLVASTPPPPPGRLQLWAVSRLSRHTCCAPWNGEREREMNLERTEISGWRDGRTEIVGVPQLKRGKKLSNPHDILRRQHPPDFGFIIKVKVRLLIGVLL